MTRALRALSCAAAVVAALAVAGPAAARADATARMTVTMTEMKFAVSAKAVARGTVVFTLVNKGYIEHDFKIAGKRSPKVQPGKRVTWRVVLAKPGKYAFVCTLPGHKAGGMHGVLTVE